MNEQIQYNRCKTWQLVLYPLDKEKMQEVQQYNQEIRKANTK